MSIQNVLATAVLFGCYQRQSGTKNTKTSAALAAEAHDAAIQGQALFNLKDSHKVQLSMDNFGWVCNCTFCSWFDISEEYQIIYCQCGGLFCMGIFVLNTICSLNLKGFIYFLRTHLISGKRPFVVLKVVFLVSLPG